MPQESRQQNKQQGNDISLGLDGLSLIDRARALCAAADDVQRATLEASRRIAAIHGTPTKSRNKAKSCKPEKELPDICARPPSDVPPPRGEGWRRLGPVSIIHGSNRICAQAQYRRALTREMEVFLDGASYQIVPANIDPGGGFCARLNRDIEGESNMACMLYLRRKERERDVATETKPREEAHTISPLSKVKSPCCTHLPVSATTTTAPFGSFKKRPNGKKGGKSGLPFSAGTDPEFDDVFGKVRPENRIDGGESTIVHEAQRRARQRARCHREREMETVNINNSESKRERPCAVDIERLKATRREALARVASVKHQEELKKEVQRKADEESRRRRAEVAATATVLQAMVSARASRVAAEDRQRNIDRDLALQEEARVKQERVRAVMTHDAANVSDRERRLRHETKRRIRREQRKREHALKREVDELLDKIRLHEGKQRHVSRPAPPVVQSARSFFSVSGSAAVSEIVDGDDKITTASSAPKASGRVTSSKRTSEKLSDVNGSEGGASAGTCDAEPFQRHKKKLRNRNRRRTVVSTRYHSEECVSSPPTSTERVHSSNLDGDGARVFEFCLNAKADSEEGVGNGNFGENTRGTVRTPGPVFPTPPTPPSSNTGGARASGTIAGSGGNKGERKRIAATPVWKRPMVPLSKPYVPVPRSEGVFAQA